MISETAKGVLVRYRTVNGESREISAKFAVGADGKTGFTRKTYMEPNSGVEMERVTE